MASVASIAHATDINSLMNLSNSNPSEADALNAAQQVANFTNKLNYETQSDGVHPKTNSAGSLAGAENALKPVSKTISYISTVVNKFKPDPVIQLLL